MNIHTKLENTRQLLNQLGNAVSNLVNSSPDVFEDETIKRSLDDFRKAHDEATQRLDTLSIATIGTVSSGKSTIVNALMGRRIAPIEAGEMSGGVLTLKHSHERKLIIEATPEAVWETGKWTGLSDDELYNKIQVVMHSYHETRKKKELIAPQIKAFAPLFPANDLSLSGLPEGVGVEFLDLPGLKSVQDRDNLAVIQPLVGKAFSLVALDYMQVDEQHRQKLLGELKRVVEYLQGRTDSMIFILNRVDNRGSDDLPMEVRLEKLKQEIKEVLSLPELPDVIPFNARLLYYAQCAWGTTALNTESNINPEVRSKLLKSMFLDCATVIKDNTSGDRNLRNWFRDIEDNLEDGIFINDETMQELLNYALKWSGGEALWSCIRNRIQESFSELVLIPALFSVFESYDAFSASLNTLIATRKIYNQEKVESEREKIANIRRDLEKSCKQHQNGFNTQTGEIIEIIKTHQPESDIKAYQYAKKKGIKEEAIAKIIDAVRDIEKDLNNSLILLVQNAFKNNSGVYELKEELAKIISPKIAEDVSRQYDHVSRRLTNFSGESDIFVKKVEASDQSAVKELEHDERYVKLLYHTMRQAITTRAEFLLQGKAKLFQDFLSYLVDNFLNELQDSLSKYGLSEINLDEAVFTDLKKKLTENPPTLPEKFFDFPVDIKQKKKIENKVVGQGTKQETYQETEYETYTYYKDKSCFQSPEQKTGTRPVKKTKTRNVQYDIRKDIEYRELCLPSPDLMAQQWASGIEKGKDELWNILKKWIIERLKEVNHLFQESVIDITDLADRALEKQLKIIEQNFEEEKEFWRKFEFTKDEVNLIYQQLKQNFN